MAKGENIFKRKDGRWEARYIKGYEATGKIKYGFCYGRTYREAKEKVTQAKSELLNGTSILNVKSKHRFSFYCDEWLRTNRNKWKISTYSKYETIVRKHIQPKFGECFPMTFSDLAVNEFTEELICEKKLAPKTVKDILVVFNSILKFTDKHFSEALPRLEIVYPKETKKEMRVLTQIEQKRFMDYLLDNMDPCKFGILLSLLTGLRIGEICALKWKNISTAENTVSIISTLQRLQNAEQKKGTKTEIIIGTPKSYNSARIIPMSNYTAKLCKSMECCDSEAFVLTGCRNFMEPRSLQYRMKRYTKECGLKDVHFHTLRHTFATRCVEVGFEIKSLSEILGHASTTITLERYIHSSIELKRRNMSKLDAVGL